MRAGLCALGKWPSWDNEYDYFGNVLEYQYDYFALYSSMSMITQKVPVLVPRVQNTIISSLATS